MTSTTAPHAHLVPGLGPVRTLPNLITLVRTALAVALGVAALALGEPWLLVPAYLTYWVGDMADGWFARRLGQETRLGAVLDILCDRACTAVLAAGLIAWAPSTAGVMALFLLSFMVLDTVLSLAFLCWPLVSPNYFASVDVDVWRLNWSSPAKVLNTTAVVLALLAGFEMLALAVVLVVAAVKIWSFRRVLTLLDARG